MTVLEDDEDCEEDEDELFWFPELEPELPELYWLPPSLLFRCLTKLDSSSRQN